MDSLQAEHCCYVKHGAFFLLHYYLEDAYIHQLKLEENVGSQKQERENWMFKMLLTFFLLFPPLFCFSITRTFASGKTEKVIFQALKELGLPSGKVSCSFE